MIYNVPTSPLMDSCSKAEYSPSVCSLTMTKSIFLCLDGTPGNDLTFNEKDAVLERRLTVYPHTILCASENAYNTNDQKT